VAPVPGVVVDLGRWQRVSPDWVLSGEAVAKLPGNSLALFMCCSGTHRAVLRIAGQPEP